MKFSIAKKDGIKCKGCPGYIDRGDEMVQTFFPTSIPGVSVPLCYHVICYIPWFTDMFNRKWSDWKNGVGNNPPPPKRGRPVKYQEATEAIKLNRLRASMCYHKKLGHTIRVKIFQEKIKHITSVI